MQVIPRLGESAFPRCRPLSGKTLISFSHKQIPTSCVFFLGLESQNHLFFECPFSHDVWFGMLYWACFSYRIVYWRTELSWICDSMLVILLVVVCGIWCGLRPFLTFGGSKTLGFMVVGWIAHLLVFSGPLRFGFIVIVQLSLRAIVSNTELMLILDWHLFS